MEATKQRKPNRTLDERREELKKKIVFHKDAIYKLEVKLESLDKPKKGRRSDRLKLLDAKMESGQLTKEEAKLLGWKE